MIIMSSRKIEKFNTFEQISNSDWFNRLVHLAECIRKNKIMKWISSIIYAFVFVMICHYIQSIFSHTIIAFPFWLWGIIPVITIIVLLLVVGIKKKIIIFLSILFGGCIGIVITGILITLFVTTNYWFANSESYHRDAYVMGKKYNKRDSHAKHISFSTYNVNLIFLDNNEYYCLDDSDIYKKCDQGDTVKVTLCKGLYDIPIIKDLHTE